MQDYQPWTVLHEIPVHVHVEGRGSIFVEVPWAAAADVESLANMAAFVARSAVHHYFPSTNPEVPMEKFEGPLVRLICAGCEGTWDAWVGEDGKLEDPRDATCSDENCPNYGVPARPIDDKV